MWFNFHRLGPAKFQLHRCCISRPRLRQHLLELWVMRGFFRLSSHLFPKHVHMPALHIHCGISGWQCSMRIAQPSLRNKCFLHSHLLTLMLEWYPRYRPSVESVHSMCTHRSWASAVGRVPTHGAVHVIPCMCRHLLVCCLLKVSNGWHTVVDRLVYSPDCYIH
jgi:hypothetical protein